MKLLSLFVSLASCVAVKDGQNCNTTDQCISDDSKCCYATGSTEAAKVYNGLYCIKETQTNIMMNG